MYKVYSQLTAKQQSQVAGMFDERIGGNPDQYIYELTRDQDVLCRKAIAVDVPVSAITQYQTEYNGQLWVTLIPSEGEDTRIWELSLTTGKVIQTAS